MGKLTKISFELVSNTKVNIIRDGKLIGHMFSQGEGDYDLPFPGDKSNNIVLNSVQICGFNSLSEVWGCGVFQGTKDICLRWDYEVKPEYEQQQRNRYEKEEGCLQGQIDLLKEMKSMYDRFAVESEGDDFILGFIKRKWKTELKELK